MTPGTLSPFTIYRGTTFGPIVLTAKNNGAAVDLTGYTLSSKAHRLTDGVQINLAPTLSDAANGVIHLMDFTDEQTAVLQDGDYEWDLVLTTGSGQVLPPSIEGTFTIKESDSI
jgi:hypothetical protein